MATNDIQTARDVSDSKPRMDFVAAVLSYLIPGLGQIFQGRIAKGLMFFACLWGLFFYGLSLGNWRNVYLPPGNVPNHGDIAMKTRFMERPFTIPHAPYWAQFCIGVAAWPAIMQANTFVPNEPGKPENAHPWLGQFERYPDLGQQEETLRNSDKTIDLGWVYTIIAGLLNILVIYDAFAGPAHGGHPIQMTSFLMFLVILTGLCVVAFVAAVGLAAVGIIHPTMYLQLPVVLVIVSLVYSATRFDLWQPILLEAIHWGWRMAMFLLVIGGVLFVVARGFAGH